MLDDILARNLALVVCGMAAGFESARHKKYYAGPGNRFWETLAALRLTPTKLKPSDARRLLEYGIGLTDLAKGQAGGDRYIRVTQPDAFALRARIVLFQPRYLCFNGKRAAQLFLRRPQLDYGVQPDRIGRTILFVAPSTSGAARGSWDITVWQDLAARVHRVQGRRLTPKWN